MSNKVIRRLKLAIEKIDLINEICKTKGISEALEDELLTKPAIMKHFDVIHQQFKKIEEEGNKEALNGLKEKDLKGIRDIRNFSSHDYDNINKNIVKDAIEKELPSLKEDLQKIVKEKEKTICKDLEKKIDYLNKKQNILISQAKRDLVNSIKKQYAELQKNGIDLDKSYVEKFKKISKDNLIERSR